MSSPDSAPGWSQMLSSPTSAADWLSTFPFVTWIHAGAAKAAGVTARTLRRWRKDESFLEDLARHQQETFSEATDRLIALAIPATAEVERAIRRENPWVALRVLDGLGVLSRRMNLELFTPALDGIPPELDQAGKLRVIELARAIKGRPSPPATTKHLDRGIDAEQGDPSTATVEADVEPIDTLTRAAQAVRP